LSLAVPPRASVPLVVVYVALLVGDVTATVGTVVSGGAGSVNGTPRRGSRFREFVDVEVSLFVTVHVKVSESDPPVAVAVTTTVCEPALECRLSAALTVGITGSGAIVAVVPAIVDARM
jgi:hypothetical protein